jgi:hypothetical protein
MLSHCLITIIGDFNVNFLTKTIQSSKLQEAMNKYNFKLFFLVTQIDHTWTNASIQQCHYGTTQT